MKEIQQSPKSQTLFSQNLQTGNKAPPRKIQESATQENHLTEIFRSQRETKGIKTRKKTNLSFFLKAETRCFGWTKQG